MSGSVRMQVSACRSSALYACAFAAACLVVPSTNARGAAYILWEAETPQETDNTQRTNWMQSKLSDDAKRKLSGGAWFSYFASKGGPRRSASYSVGVPGDGSYILWARKFHSHGPFEWRFDGGAWQTCGKTIRLHDTTDLGGGLVANWVKLGRVELAKGARSFEIRIISTPDRDINASIDCFLLSADANFVPAGLVAPSASMAAPAARERPRGEGTFFLRAGDRVLFIGDAVTQEGGYVDAVRRRITSEYPALVADDRRGLRFLNVGSAGATASHAARQVISHITRHKPTVAVVCLGVTDFYADQAGYDTGIEQIVEALARAKVAATILTPLALDARSRPELADGQRVLERMVSTLRVVAARLGARVADCHAPSRAHISRGGADLSWGDGIHPNRTGQRMMAEALLEAWGVGKPLQ